MKTFQQAPFLRQLWAVLKISFKSRYRAKTFFLEIFLPILFLVFVIIFMLKAEVSSISPTDDDQIDQQLGPISIISDRNPREYMLGCIGDENVWNNVCPSIFIRKSVDDPAFQSATQIKNFTTFDEYKTYVRENLETSDPFLAVDNTDSDEIKVSTNGNTTGTVVNLVTRVAQYLSNQSYIGATFAQYPVEQAVSMDSQAAVSAAIFAVVFSISGILNSATLYGKEVETGLRDFMTFYGLSDAVFYVRWYIICYVFLIIPAIVYSIVMTIIGSLNFLFILVHYIISCAALTSFSLAWIALIPKEDAGQLVGYGTLLSFFIFIFAGYFSFLEKEGEWGLKGFFSIFPTAAMGYNLFYIVSRKCTNFSELNSQNYYPIWVGWAFLGAEAVVYFIIFILIDYFRSRTFLPPKYKWKRSGESPKPDSASIQIQNLTKKYGDYLAVDNLSFVINRGETLAVVGPNGAGKSTTLSLLCGFREATSGQILFNGVDIVKDIRAMHSMVGLCLQENVFMADLSPDEWLKFICALRNEPNYDYSAIISALDLGGQLKYRIGSMSGGNKRKICLATALVCDPSIVLLDEAIAGVDFTSRTKIWSVISSLKDTTVILTTHSLDECEKIADKVLILEYGKIGYLETPNDLHRIFNCGYQIDCSVEHIHKLSAILTKKSIKATIEVDDNRVSATIPTNDPIVISSVLKNIDFKFILSIQSLEDKVFLKIQEDERKRELMKDGYNPDDVDYEKKLQEVKHEDVQAIDLKEADDSKKNTQRSVRSKSKRVSSSNSSITETFDI